MKRLYFYSLVILSLAISNHTLAGVNIKNGNFYISYTDHSFVANGGLDLTRTYNSKATETGIFGYGWGSVIEDRLFFIGDGSIVLKYGGAGGQINYVPLVSNQNLINRCVMQIITVMVKNNDLVSTPVNLANEKLKLFSSSYRATKWMKYAKMGLLKNETKPSGMYYAPDWYTNTLSFSNNSFVSNSFGGEKKYFDTIGNFTESRNKNNELLFAMQYDGNKLKTLTDGAGNKFEFEMDENGRVLTIGTSKGKSTYKYDRQNNLVMSQDIALNKYLHQYDKMHNMTQISYADNTHLKIEYDQNTFFVSQIINRDLSNIRYNYKNFYAADGSIDDNHYATWVLKKKPNSSLVDTTYYEYHYKNTAQGNLYQYKFIKKEGNDYYESRSNALDYPIWVKHNAKQASFKHNSAGRLSEKETTTYRIVVSYDKIHSEIASIEKLNKKTGRKTLDQFTYTKNGYLAEAKTSNYWIKLTYNDKDLITKYESSLGQITVEYDEENRPILVTAQSIGTIKNSYKNGEIVKVESLLTNTNLEKVKTLYAKMIKQAEIPWVSYEP